MTRRTTIVFSLIAVLCIVFIQVTAAATSEAQARPQLARTEVRSTSISWQPVVAFESAVLTVSGPENLNILREFAPGESLELGLIDANGDALEDGGYTWELRFAPVLAPGVKEALRAARERDDPSVVAELKKKGQLPEEPMVLSGHFSVKSGAIVVDKVESSTRRGSGRVEPLDSTGTIDSDTGIQTKDQVINDDLIATSSICAGFDCVNGENFGFDTLRLKENNLRFHFQDTSTGSFPSNDWRLIANDSSSGGANYFAIEDSNTGRQVFKVEAGAPSNSLYVDDGGRVGLGTSTPSVELHVKDGDTPTLRLEQDGSSGFSPQTWDVAGNETNFFIRDVTNGSQLPFKIRPGADSDSLVISLDNNVGIGAGTSPSASLHVKRSNGTAQLLVEETNGTSELRTQLRMVNNGPVNTQHETGAATWRQQFQNNAYTLTKDSTGGNEMTIIAGTGDMTIRGSLFTGGPSCGAGCDEVLGAGFNVESIEEHANAMWAAGYLPAIGPINPGQPTNITEKLGGVLNELEKAHIYIEQLQKELALQRRQLKRLEALLNEKEVD